MPEVPCLFCYGITDALRAIVAERGHLLLEDMCAPHATEQSAMLAEYQAAHPGGGHTETCGCISLEEFDRRYPELNTVEVN